MSGVSQVRVAKDEAGIRLDRWFKRHYPDLSHGRLEKLLRKGQVRVDGGRVKAGQRLEAGQTVRVPPLSAEPTRPQKRRREVDPRDVEMLRERVLYQDVDVIALNKPAGLAVQGGSQTPRHLDGMLDCLQFDAKERPKLVHRLDKDTSGVLLLARSAKAAGWLTAAFRDKDARKLYWALVVGQPPLDEGIINAPLVKLPGKGGERVTVSDAMGQPAQTGYRVIDHAGRKAAWLALEPFTGRTHQLRVHCLHMGNPVVGDGKYGGAEAHSLGQGIDKGMHLHARSISISKPNGGILTIKAPLPDHMVETWNFLGFNANELNSDTFFEDLE